MGSNVQDAGDNKPAECAYPLESVDITLATMEDMQCVHKHLNDLRIATGVAPVLQDGVLKVYGSGKKLVRAQQLVQTLLETGEWVAFSEAFVLSEETKQKRRASDGPSTQLLIKLPECIGIKVVEKHLASMELAAEADQLKLSSKPVGGKRTLMVEGPPKAHERVKLMVKELMERGQSAMLTKFLNGSRAGTARPAPSAPPAEAAPKAPPHAVVTSVSSAVAPGVVQSPPVLTPAAAQIKTEVKEEIKEEPLSDEEAPKPATAKKELPKLGAGFRLMAPPARVKAVKPGETMDVDDLFAGLPEPSEMAAAVPTGPADGAEGITE